MFVLVALVSAIFINEAFAVEYKDNTGYTPKWAKTMGQGETLNFCGLVPTPSQDADWCKEFGAYVNQQFNSQQPSSQNPVTVQEDPFNKQFFLESRTVEYKLSGGEIKSIDFDKNGKAILLSVDQIRDGFLRISIPRNLLDSQAYCSDSDFGVYVEEFGTSRSTPVSYDEESSTEKRRVLKINLNGYDFSTNIKIQGTHVLMTPEQIANECEFPTSGTNNPQWMMVASENDKQGVHIKSLYDFEDKYGYYHIIGEVVNNSDTAYEFVKLVVTVYDINQNVLDTEFTYAIATILQPYGKSPFELTLPGGSQGVDSYLVQVEASPTTPLPKLLELSTPRIYDDKYGYTHIVGEVKNMGPGTANFVKVISSFYNSDGDIIGTSFSYTTLSDIYSGSSSPFEITVDFTDTSTSYALYAESQESGAYFEEPIMKTSVEELTKSNEEKTITPLVDANTIPQKDEPQMTEEKLSDTEQTSNESKGGCLIATATYGSELAPQVQQLRELRDTSLLQTESGTSFMRGFNQFYYSFSPTIADWERENPAFKEFVKITLTPMISSLSILNYVDMDSEASVLGYGISLILLNIGMYFVAPVVVIHTIKKKF